MWDAVSIMSPRSAISYRDIGTSTALAPGLRDAILKDLKFN